MTSAELKEEIAIELENIETVLRELFQLHNNVQGREASLLEKTAASAFLAQFYNGLENILKRISRYCNVPLPTGEIWHVELFRRFCTPPASPLPALFDPSLAADLAPYRKFRHVVHHGYGFQLHAIPLSLRHKGHALHLVARSFVSPPLQESPSS